MGVLLSLHFISSTVSSSKQILSARVPNKKEVQTSLPLTQRQPISEDLDWPNKRLHITEPLWKREQSRTPEQILLTNLPDEREVQKTFVAANTAQT